MNRITVAIEVSSEEQEHVAQMLSSCINRIIFNHPDVKVHSQSLILPTIGERERTPWVSHSIGDVSRRYWARRTPYQDPSKSQ
jgi:hypothetical protein